MSEIKLSLLKNLTLLLVEDDEDLLKQFQSILILFFEQVFIAKNGLEALDIYTNNQIDMIITDYVMPILDGHDLCKAIRLKNKNIPIVIMSSYTDRDRLLNAIKLGLVDYLIKPFDYNVLINTLNSMASKMEEEHIHNFKLSDSLKYSSVNNEVIDTSTGIKIKLTKNEIELLELFVYRQGQIITYNMIEHTLWSNDSKGNESIKNIIYRLRKKLGKNLIVNIQDMGYVLRSLE
jgi:DNA-binding response OmpR family regulator